MYKIIAKITLLASCIIFHSCSTPEIKITDVSFKVSEDIGDDFFKPLKIFREKAEKAIEKLEENKDYKEANIQVTSEFSSEEASTSTLNLSFQYDKTMDSNSEELKTLGKEAFKVVVAVLQSTKPYDKYEVKFLQDINKGAEDKDNFKVYTYTIEELQ